MVVIDYEYEVEQIDSMTAVFFSLPAGFLRENG